MSEDRTHTEDRTRQEDPEKAADEVEGHNLAGQNVGQNVGQNAGRNEEANSIRLNGSSKPRSFPEPHGDSAAAASNEESALCRHFFNTPPTGVSSGSA